MIDGLKPSSNCSENWNSGTVGNVTWRKSESANRRLEKMKKSTKGMAATSHPLSTLEAISILKKGGNAIDAAIAASAVQAVVEPGSTGVGGDCFALVSINGKKTIAINGSGIAPLKATFDYFKTNKIKNYQLTGICDLAEKKGKMYAKKLKTKFFKDFKKILYNL